MKSKPVKKKITVIYDYTSLKERKFRCKGVATVIQTETLLLCSASNLQLAERPFKRSPGATKGDAIGPVAVTPLSKC